MSKIILQAQNLSKSFAEKKILKNINFEVVEREICAVIGSSGCGKSTLLQICGLLDNNFEGEILLNKNPTKNLSSKEKTTLRKFEIGFVYQFHFLIPELTVFQNAAISLQIQKIPTQEIKIRIEALLKNLDIFEQKDQFPHQISGGQAQRLAIARSIAHKPKLIIADEPTGNLDAQNTENIFQIFQEIAQKHNTAILLATHNLKLAQNCHQIIDL